MTNETSPAMEKFEAVLRAALKTVTVGAAGEDTGLVAQTDTAEGLIIEAADQLLLESAMEMSEATVNGICGILLHVYKNGRDPGKTQNPLMNELVAILLRAGHADHSAEDTY